MIYFTSDEHYEHKNIIRYSERPFSSLEEMREVMLENHNKVVKDNDLTIHLGDYSFENDPDKVHNFLSKFNGRHEFLRGSHDYWQSGYSRKYKVYFDSIKEVKCKDKLIVCCHYCMLTWPRSHYGTWHLFGHHHGKLTHNLGKSYDAGVDCNDFTPISFDQVVEIMKKRPDNLNEIKKG